MIWTDWVMKKKVATAAAATHSIITEEPVRLR